MQEQATQGRAPMTAPRAVYDGDAVDLSGGRIRIVGPSLSRPTPAEDPALVEEMAKAYSDEAPRHGPFRGAVRPEVVTAHTACMARVLALLVSKGWGPAGSAEEIARLKAELDALKAATSTPERCMADLGNCTCSLPKGHGGQSHVAFTCHNPKLGIMEISPKTRKVMVRKVTRRDVSEMLAHPGGHYESLRALGFRRRVGPKP